MRVSSITKNAGKACNNRLYRHIRTFEKIIKNYFVIYLTLFQPFDWEALRYDLTVRNFYSHQAKEVPPTDVMEAEVRLNDYQYYVGESKIRKTKPKTAKASNNTQPSQI